MRALEPQGQPLRTFSKADKGQIWPPCSADYARAGFKVMPVVDPGGKITSLQIALHSFSVLPVVLLPAFCGMAGTGYEVGALCVGTAYMGMGLKASWNLEKVATRRLFLASLIYLPLIFGMLWMGA